MLRPSTATMMEEKMQVNSDTLATAQKVIATYNKSRGDYDLGNKKSIFWKSMTKAYSLAVEVQRLSDFPEPTPIRKTYDRLLVPIMTFWERWVFLWSNKPPKNAAYAVGKTYPAEISPVGGKISNTQLV